MIGGKGTRRHPNVAKKSNNNAPSSNRSIDIKGQKSRFETLPTQKGKPDKNGELNDSDVKVGVIQARANLNPTIHR